MEASHEEVNNLRAEIASLNSKLDMLSLSIASIHTILAETRGANIPQRVFKLEEKVADMTTKIATNDSMSTKVEKHETKIDTMQAFIYKAVGALIVFELVMVVAGKFILDKVFG